MAQEQPRYGIVGLGRLGLAIADALRHARLELSAVVPHSATSTRAVHEVFAEVRCDMQTLPSRANRIFVTVPDDRLRDVAAALVVGKQHWVVHCSGAMDLSILASAQQLGARVGCFHPLQAFPEGSGAERFVGVTVGLDGDLEVLRELEQLASRFGARSLSLVGVDRARYHAAAVFASNYAVALMEAAVCAFADAGLPAHAAPAALLPLMEGAVAAMGTHSLVDALTGPIARGDVETVRVHVASLRHDPELLQAYVDLGRFLLRLEKPADAKARGALRSLFATASTTKQSYEH